MPPLRPTAAVTAAPASSSSSATATQRLRRRRTAALRRHLQLAIPAPKQATQPTSGPGTNRDAGIAERQPPGETAADPLPVSGFTFESADQAISFVLGLLGPTAQQQQPNNQGAVRRGCRNRVSSTLPAAVPPATLVPVAALYALVKRNTTVDREIDLLVRRGQLRRFRFGGTRFNPNYVVMHNEDYLEQIQTAKELFKRELRSLRRRRRELHTTKVPGGADGGGAGELGWSSTSDTPPQQSPLDVDERPIERARLEMFDVFHDIISSGKHTDTSISQAVLMDEYGMREEEITQLITYSLLTTEPPGNVFKFSARGAGAFVTNLVNGRTEMCRFLNRRKYKEMLESQILARKLTTSAFPAELILLELLGSGKAECIHTTMGPLVKLTRKGEEMK